MEDAFRRAAVLNASLIKLSTLDLHDLDTEDFRQRVDAAISVLQSTSSGGAVRLAEQRLADDTQRYLNQQETMLRSREEEFNATVALLTDAVVQFRDTNQDFTSQVLDRGDRMSKLMAIDDLRTLRSRLGTELTELKSAAIEKQEADARQIAALSAKVDALEGRLALATTQAHHDPLTGLGNRAAWEQKLAEVGQRLATGDFTVAAAMIDMDYFKQINDTYGHAAGDEVLRAFADLTRQHLTDDDFVVRYGGDEFAAIMTAPLLQLAAARLLKVIEAIHKRNEAARAVGQASFTISVGLAFARPGDTTQTLLDRADRALYAAKQEGRDRLVIAA